MKVNVDFDRCEGHGLCVTQAADAFSLNDDGELDYHFDGDDVPADMEDDVRAAIGVCPVAALSESP
ncbi:ferredoxin [Mycobacterium deserti]|uniref:Ferredoxin n=1 Tax=Mycobacterium deserti TaxID=2978347 RepID=A0ABT2MDL0_9MYCO|nr:ferredoxin [Mycobacterium deserti]MCT7660349.1 ferredoxin [Mycobacterium deserti]